MFLRLSLLISRINLARTQRIESFEVMYTKVNFRFTYKLEQLGLIRGFNLENDKLRIYMKYVNKSVPFTKIQLVSKSSRRSPIRLEKLLKVADKHGSSIFILSTGRGFLTHSECFISKCSGDIIAKIDV